ncbi:MAG: flagellar motor switch protein FliN [Armatimonadota bacterium]
MITPESPVMPEATVETIPEPTPSEAFIPSAAPVPNTSPINTDESNINLLSGVEVTATVELGQTRMLLRDVLKLHRGSVIELDKLVGQPADLLINNIIVARGEVIVLNERFGFRVSKFVAPNES